MDSHEPAPDRPREQQLVRSVIDGDRAALDEFHRHYSAPLYRFVFYRLAGSVTDTEEVVQETFVSALESLHRFRGRSSLHTWLCGIAKNRIGRLRRQRSRQRLASVLEHAESEIEELVRSLDEEELPDAALEREETQDLVGATLASLPPSYQSVLLDKYVESLPVDEMARRRSSTTKAVESRLSRARQAFRRTFELLARRFQEGPGHA